MYKSWIAAVVLGAAVAAMAAGCNGSAGTATAIAVAQADEALGRVRDAAAKHAPAELAPVEEQMRIIKADLALRRYKSVDRMMQKLGPDLQNLIAVTQERRAKFETERTQQVDVWNRLSAEVPPLIERLESRFSALQKSGQRPRGMDAQQFEAAKQELEAVKAAWAQADDAVTRSNAAEAAEKVTEAKTRGEALLKKLS
ncbi:MAG TPA: hypothetical protein VFR59_07315 [Steroidobacteraceae bacterium]|nr:hypothetical protein [Steroidobacteraceae bacterium]